MQIVALNIFFTLLFVLCYWAEIRRSGSYVNVFTPYFAIALPSRFILDLFYVVFIGPVGEPLSYLIVYATSVLEFLGLILGYRAIHRGVVYKISLFQPNRASGMAAWSLLLISIVLYLPILAGNLDLIFSPREIYTATRTGGGASFFLSITFGYLSFIAFLFSGKKKLASSVLFILLLATSLLLHGNKAPLVVLFFIYLIYVMFILGKRISAVAAVKYGMVLIGAVVALFYVTFSQSMKEDTLVGIALYADYNRNYIKVIEAPPPLQYGKLTIENNVMAMVPRALFPGKPKNFGTFFLAEYYYPEWFEADTGSPAFGYGVQYADFSYLALIYIFITSILIGLLLKVFVNRLGKYRSPADFVMVLFFCGVSLLELGAGYLLIPHLFIALFFAIFLKMLRSLRCGFQSFRFRHQLQLEKPLPGPSS